MTTNCRNILDCRTILYQTAEPIPPSVPVHGKRDLIMYLTGIESRINTSIRDKTQKIATEMWKTAKNDIVCYFSTALQNMPGNTRTLDEIIARLNHSGKRRGRPPKKPNPWRFG